MHFFADMISFTEMAYYAGNDAPEEIAAPHPNPNEQRESYSLSSPREAPPRPLEQDDDDAAGSKIPDNKGLTPLQPCINILPPRPKSTPDVYPTPCAVYEPRIHPFNCTCGCKIREENYMEIDSVNKTYMESSTCFYLLGAGSLEWGSYGPYQKKKS